MREGLDEANGVYQNRPNNGNLTELFVVNLKICTSCISEGHHTYILNH